MSWDGAICFLSAYSCQKIVSTHPTTPSTHTHTHTHTHPHPHTHTHTVTPRPPRCDAITRRSTGGEAETAKKQDLFDWSEQTVKCQGDIKWRGVFLLMRG